MSNSIFPEANGLFDTQINPNLNPKYTKDFLDFENYLYNNHQEFDIYNIIGFDPANNEDSTCSFSNAYLSQSPVTQEMTSTGSVGSSFNALPENTNIQEIVRDVNGENDAEHSLVAFRIKTELEVLDDGYKWRKYGKKMVKSNSNPRNYYKCSIERCRVKKRVERDPQDSSYVITTYEGVHNHQSLTHITHTLPTRPFTLHIINNLNKMQ